MARRFVRLFALAGLVLWLLRRRGTARAHAAESVTIGYADGTSTVLEAGSHDRERLIDTAGQLA